MKAAVKALPTCSPGRFRRFVSWTFVFTSNSAKLEGETYQRSRRLWLNLTLRLHGAVEGLAGRREQVPKFNEAGSGRGLRGTGGPRAGQVGSALQAVGSIGCAGEADEQTAAAVARDRESNVPVQNHAVVDERAVEAGRAAVEEDNLPVVH